MCFGPSFMQRFHSQFGEEGDKRSCGFSHCFIALWQLFFLYSQSPTITVEWRDIHKGLLELLGQLIHGHVSKRWVLMWGCKWVVLIHCLKFTCSIVHGLMYAVFEHQHVITSWNCRYIAIDGWRRRFLMSWRALLWSKSGYSNSIVTYQQQ